MHDTNKQKELRRYDEHGDYKMLLLYSCLYFSELLANWRKNQWIMLSCHLENGFSAFKSICCIVRY